MIYDEYLFGLQPIPGTKLLKPLKLHKQKINVTFVMLQVTLGTYLRMGAGRQESQPRDKRINTVSPTLLTSASKEGLKVESVTDDLIKY